MDKTIIQYFIFPFHIDLLERTILQLKRASLYSNTKDWLYLDVVFNMSDDNFDWNSCKIPKQFFIDKFRFIEKYCDFCKEVNFDINDEIKGSGEQERRLIEKGKGEFGLILLDPDIYFSPQIFFVMDNTIPIIEKETKTYMITPQIAKFWDDSWNVISNEKYIQSDIKFDDVDVFQFEKELDIDNISLIKNYQIKYAGGWLNYYSKELLKYLELPESIGFFDYIDFFTQEKIKIMNSSGKFDVPQYIIKNCIIGEDRKYYHKNVYLQNYIPLKKRTQNREQIYQNVVDELNKFSKIIKEN